MYFFFALVDIHKVVYGLLLWFMYIFVLHVDEVCGEDDQEDTEYNFMAEDQKEEKEEYRNDRAVRIPRE